MLGRLAPGEQVIVAAFASQVALALYWRVLLLQPLPSASLGWAPLPLLKFPLRP